MPIDVRRRLTFALYVALCVALYVALSAGVTARADDADGRGAPERGALHGQFTFVEQATDGFNAPYAGTNSLSPRQGRETADVTLYLGAAPWPGAELWLTPELDQGFGVNDTLGLAGFTSGEAYKIGKREPYLRLPRAFLRQTWNSGDGRETVAAGAIQLSGVRSADRWVVTIGKLGVTDIFDDNEYAHDPRTDFLNWTAVDAGAFDYAADAWGFTVGAAAERYQGTWVFRAGVFDLSNVPNSTHLEPGGHEFQLDAELEKRGSWFGNAGRVLVTVFDSRARMGLLNSAVQRAASTGTPVDIAAVRQYRSRLGVSLNLQQQFAADMGLFVRIGKAAGNVEAYEFTDVDRSVSAGLSVTGARWQRADDTAGLAALVNGISAARERYLNAGGLGILVGDGRLPHPGAEEILETYYSLAVVAQAWLSLDYQWIRNPAYNTDRGPVSVFSIRLHAQF